jgi:hypothetical protein
VSRLQASVTEERARCRTSPSSPAVPSVDEESASPTRTLKLEILGQAKKVIVSKDDCTIIDGKGEKSETSLRESSNSRASERDSFDSKLPLTTTRRRSQNASTSSLEVSVLSESVVLLKLK